MLRILIILIILLSACFKATEQSDNSALVKLGIMLPLTGPLAEYGTATRNGILLAQAENPDVFKNIQLVFQDHQYLPKKSVTIFKQLNSDSQIRGIYCWGTEPNEPLVGLADQYKIPLFAASTNNTVNNNSEYTYRTAQTGYDYAIKLNKHFDQNNYKKILIIKDELTFFNDILNHLTAASSDIKIEIISSGNSVENLKTLVQKLKQNHYDALGVFLGVSGTIELYKQLNNQKITISTFGTDFFDSAEIRKNSGPTISGAVYPTIYAAEEFRVRYQKKYNSNIMVNWAASAYDSVLFLAKSCQGKCKINSETFSEQGQSGKLQFDAKNRAIVFDVVLQKV